VTVAEDWAFTTQSGTLDLTTTSDSLCFISAQVATESATFTITGGTGLFRHAHGSGTFKIVDLTTPPDEYGVFTATIN